jgi:CHAD domain-containing protein
MTAAMTTRESSTRRITSGKRKRTSATGSHSTAGEVVLRALQAEITALRKAERQVRDGAPQGVTRMRDTARQLRSTLRGFSRVLDRPSTQPVLAELAWLGRELGGQNDTERTIKELRRQHQVMPPEVIVGPVVEHARSELDQLAGDTGHITLAALDSERYAALRRALDQLVDEPPFTERAARPAAKELPKNIGKAMRIFDRKLVTALSLPAGHERDQALHEARKADKQLRYATEVAVPVLGKKALRQARQAKKLQDLLGEYQDAVVARSLVRALEDTAAASGQPLSTYHLVDALEQVRIDCVLEKLPLRLSKLYDAAAWLPKAGTLRYDPRTSAAWTGSAV